MQFSEKKYSIYCQTGNKISKHPFYSIDISHIRSFKDINEKEIK